MAKIIEATQSYTGWSTMSRTSIRNVFFYGLLVGVVTYSLYYLLDHVLFQAILCSERASASRCSASHGYANGVSIVIGSIIGLVLLVRERIYRPILAIIGVCTALWAVSALLFGAPFIIGLFVTGLLFAVAYVLFSWLVQPTSLVASLLGVALLAAIARVSTSL